MNVAIRADSSFEIGSGHIMRTLSLARELRARGSSVSFISQDLPGNVLKLVPTNDFDLSRIPVCALSEDIERTKNILEKQSFDWLVVDNYKLNIDFEDAVKGDIRRVMVIDDLANRKHTADLLLDQNYYSNSETRYEKLLPSSCRKVLGPKFTLLREEFSEARKNLKGRDGSLNSIFINFGGSDPTNETIKVLEALKKINLKNLKVSVVAGVSQKNIDKVKAMCEGLQNASFHIQVDNISKYMAEADLGIGAGGTSSWERCCLGLPSLATILADNQKQLVEDLAEYGAVINMGQAEKLTSENYARVLSDLSADSLKEMGARARELVDGSGCKRVVDIMEQIS